MMKKEVAVSHKKLILAILEKHKWSQLKLADKIDVSEWTVSRWLNEDVVPRAKKMLLLKKLLNGGTPAPMEKPTSPTLINVPILAAIPRGPIEQEATLGQCQFPAWLFGIRPENVYIIQVATADMAPRYKMGDFLIVRHGTGFSLGETVLMVKDEQLRAVTITTATLHIGSSSKIIGTILTSFKREQGVY